MINNQKISSFFLYFILIFLFVNFEINLFEIASDTRIQLADTTHIVNDELDTVNLRSNKTIISITFYSIIILAMLILILFDRNTFRNIKNYKTKNIIYFSALIFFLIGLTILNIGNYTSDQFYLALMRAFKFFEIIIFYYFLQTYYKKFDISYNLFKWLVVIFFFINLYSYIYLEINNESRIDIYFPFILALICLSKIKHNFFLFIFELIFFVIIYILSKTTLIYLLLAYFICRLITDYFFNKKINIFKVTILIISLSIFTFVDKLNFTNQFKLQISEKIYNGKEIKNISDKVDKIDFDINEEDCLNNTFCLRLNKIKYILTNEKIKFIGSGSYSSVFIHNLTPDNAYLEIMIDFGILGTLAILMTILGNINFIYNNENNIEIYIHIILVFILLGFVSQLLYSNKIFLTLILINFLYKKIIKD